MKKFVIYGLGISGISTAKFLAAYLAKDDTKINNYKIYLTDDNVENLIKYKKDFNETEVEFVTPDQLKLDDQSTVIFSPGIPLYFPKRHTILDLIEKTKARLICDVELFFEKNKKNKFIGITGSNGKSTISALTDFLFKEMNIISHLCGNFGIPCFNTKINNENEAIIIEISSFQLDLIDKLHFNISNITNITPDHIDRHGNFENYICSKKRIYQNSTKGDFIIMNEDDEISQKIIKEIKNKDLLTISTTKISENGISFIGDEIFNNINGNKEIFKVGETFLKGNHNKQNICFAYANIYCFALINNIIDETNRTDFQKKLIEKIKIFKGLKHRAQYVGMIGDIRFINDSKATNIESCVKSLEAYENIYLIFGGKRKSDDISPILPYKNKIRKIYLIGESEKFFYEKFNGEIEVEMSSNLKIAINNAFIDAKNNKNNEKNIILSPGCASFDQWKNFEERGEFFCNEVANLIASK